MFICSQIFGLLGFVLVVVAMTLKSRSQLLGLKLGSTALILCSYGFVGSTPGILVASVSLVRGVLAFWLSRRNRPMLRRISIAVLCVAVVSLHIVFWEGAINILAAAASLISVFCFFQSRIFYIRLISILTSVLEIILNLVILNPMNIVIELFTISACVFGIAQNDLVIWKVKRKLKKVRRHEKAAAR